MLISLSASAQTIITGGYVSGQWDSGSSPYYVQGNILVHADSTLEINAGTIVLFADTRRLEVHGQLLVTGTPSQPVILDRDSVADGWQGIYFNTTDTSITDSSILVTGFISHANPAPGITISSSGRLRISDFTIDHCMAFRGAGINCIDSDPYFSGISIHSNTGLDGTGMALENSTPVMKNCTFNDNEASGAGAGIVIFAGSNPVIEDCFFYDNQSSGSGGGMYINDASPVIRNCHFEGNQGAVGGSSMYSGGAVSIKLYCKAAFENCTFKNNISYTNGGGIATFSETRIINCLFNADSAEVWGGGVFLSSSYLTSPITNCSFLNTNSQKGTALATHNHKAVTRNCIFWHENPTNPNSFIFLDSQFNWNLLDISYCDIQNGENGIEDGGTTQYTYGLGNIDDDPALFPGNGEPGWQSPCIEAGTPDTSGLFLPEYDLSGNPRLANDRIDMGAQEYQLSLIVLNSRFQVPGEFSIYPNPAKDKVFISFPAIFNDKSKEIIVYNSIGNPVKTIDTRDGVPVISTDISELPDGLYFLVMMIDGKLTSTGKLVVVD